MPDDKINRLMKNLGKTIQEILAESPRMNDSFREIRDAGYETFLVIEAKIGFSRKDNVKSATHPDISNEHIRLQITPEDAKFLKSLKIDAD